MLNLEIDIAPKLIRIEAIRMGTIRMGAIQMEAIRMEPSECHPSEPIRAHRHKVPPSPINRAIVSHFNTLVLLSAPQDCVAIQGYSCKLFPSNLLQSSSLITSTPSSSSLCNYGRLTIRKVTYTRVRPPTPDKDPGIEPVRLLLFMRLSCSKRLFEMSKFLL
ncbi:hypothetical protein Hdeb2414_s0023g00639081 [Helianthus debilis subsp. tardiflorus]